MGRRCSPGAYNLETKMTLMTEQKPAAKVYCETCNKLVFKTSVCVCGTNLTEKEKSTIAERIKTSTIQLPSEATDILLDWLKAYMELHGGLSEDHAALMEKLGLGTTDNI